MSIHKLLLLLPLLLCLACQSDAPNDTKEEPVHSKRTLIVHSGSVLLIQNDSTYLDFEYDYSYSGSEADWFNPKRFHADTSFAISKLDSFLISLYQVKPTDIRKWQEALILPIQEDTLIPLRIEIWEKNDTFRTTLTNISTNGYQSAAHPFWNGLNKYLNR